MNTIKVFTDGGSRGNPGQAAIGIVIKNTNNQILWQTGKAIGIATNNDAEYKALIHALEWIKNNSHNVDQINFYLDSLLVVSQMSGKYKVKAPNIKILWPAAKQIEKTINIPVNYTYIPREQNYLADSLLNKALDLLK